MLSVLLGCQAILLEVEVSWNGGYQPSAFLDHPLDRCEIIRVTFLRSSARPKGMTISLIICDDGAQIRTLSHKKFFKVVLQKSCSAQILHHFLYIR